MAGVSAGVERGSERGLEIIPNNLLYCSPEKYVLKFPSGKLPTKQTQYKIDYQFSDGSVRTDIFVEVLSPNVLLVYHPALQKPCKFTATLHPIGNKAVVLAKYSLRAVSPMEYVYKKMFCSSSHNQSSSFAMDQKVSQAFFAALLAYYSNIESKENDSDNVNVDVMFYNLLHSFQNFCGNERRWNIAAVTAGLYGSQENLLHFALRRCFEASATHLVNAYLQSYEYVLFEKARNGDTAADLANKSGLKGLEDSIRQKMAALKPYEVVSLPPTPKRDNKEKPRPDSTQETSVYQPLVFQSPIATASVASSGTKYLEDDQAEFIQTLKRSTVTLATVIKDYNPDGKDGCMPLQRGELVHIMQHNDNGWCFGVATDKYGFFPMSIIKESDDMVNANGLDAVKHDNCADVFTSLGQTTPTSPAYKDVKKSIMILDEINATGIPSIDSLKTRSQYRAKLLEYYRVAYLSSASGPTVELTAGETVDVLEEVDTNWCRSIYKSFICLLPKAILTRLPSTGNDRLDSTTEEPKDDAEEDTYEIMNLNSNNVVIHRDMKKKGRSQKGKKPPETPPDTPPIKVKHDNSPVVQQKSPITATTIKKPVRKAPPPPVQAYKTANRNTSKDHQPESPTVKELKPIVNSASKTQEQQHQPPKEQDSIHDQCQPPPMQQQPATIKHLSKSSSCSEIVNAQGRRVPPPPPLRDSSLSSESYDDHGTDRGDDKGSSSQELKQGRASKPVPKRRTKSVHH